MPSILLFCFVLCCNVIRCGVLFSSAVCCFVLFIFVLLLFEFQHLDSSVTAISPASLASLTPHIATLLHVLDDLSLSFHSTAISLMTCTIPSIIFTPSTLCRCCVCDSGRHQGGSHCSRHDTTVRATSITSRAGESSTNSTSVCKLM